MGQRFLFLVLGFVFLFLSGTTQTKFQKEINLPNNLEVAGRSGKIVNSPEDGYLITTALYKDTGNSAEKPLTLICKIDSCYSINYIKTYEEVTDKAGTPFDFSSLSKDDKGYYFRYAREGPQTDYNIYSKINKNGTLEWSKKTTLHLNEKIEAQNQSVTIISNSSKKNRLTNDYAPPEFLLFTKFHSNGNLLTSKKIQDNTIPNLLSFADFIHTSSNGYLLIMSDSTDNSVYAKLNSKGERLWSKKIYPANKEGSFQIHKILEVKSTKFAFMGTYINGDQTKPIIGFFDSLGNPKSVKVLDLPDNHGAFVSSIIKGKRGNIILGGNLEENNSLNTSGMLASITQKGQIKWSKNYPKVQFITDILATEDSGVMATGGKILDELSLIKTDKNGKTSCIEKPLDIKTEKIKVKDSIVTFQIDSISSPFKDTSALYSNHKEASTDRKCSMLPKDTILCEKPDTITLDAIGVSDELINDSSTIKWNTGDTTSKINVSKPGQYWVKVENNGCISTDTINVFRPQVGLNMVSEKDTLCWDESLSLTYESENISNENNLNIEWLMPNNLTLKKDSIQVKDSGLYHFKASYQRCNYMDSFKLYKANPELKTNLKQDTTLCPSDTLAIDLRYSNGTRINEGAKFQWNTGETSPQKLITEAGLYTVTVEKQGCTKSDSIRVWQPSLQIRTDTALRAICPYDSLLARAKLSEFRDTAGQDWQWTLPGGASKHKDSLYMVQEGTYHLTIPAHRCLLKDSFSLSHHSLPQPQAGPDSTICYGDSLTLHGKGGVTYRWRPPDYLDDPEHKNPVANPPDTQRYFLITSNAEGCSDTDRVWINVRPPLQAKGSSNGRHFCEGDSIKLEAGDVKGGYEPSRQIRWYQENRAIIGDGPSVTVQADSAMASRNAGTQFILKLTDGCSLPFYDTVSVSVEQRPEVEQTMAPTEGCSPLEVAFKLENELPDHYNFEWHLPDGTVNGSPAFKKTFSTETGIRQWAAGGYRITSDSGCQWRDDWNDSITVKPSPQADFEPIPDSTDIENPLIRFDNLSEGANRFQWDFGNGATSIRKNPEYQYDSAGTYQAQLTGVNEHLCKDSATKEIIVSPVFHLYLPNAFSPNQNALNEAFRPKGTGIQRYHLKVFNRWGEKVFEGANEGWDGNYKGEPCPAGTYLYIIEVEYRTAHGISSEYRNGNLNLIR